MGVQLAGVRVRSVGGEQWTKTGLLQSPLSARMREREREREREMKGQGREERERDTEQGRERLYLCFRSSSGSNP